MAKPSKPFEGLRCPHCGETDCVSVKADTLVVSCDECSEPITVAEIDAVFSRWNRLFNWVESAATFANPK